VPAIRMKERSSAEMFLSSGTVPLRAARRSGQLDHRAPGSESGHELTARTGHALRVIAEQAGTERTCRRLRQDVASRETSRNRKVINTKSAG
jgi:hypothetical protein